MYKTVLITGASRGIGRAIACAYAREGCRLVINCSRSEKELLALADELRETCHVDVLTSIGDVSDYAYMEQLFSQSEARFGGIDILVNNAGVHCKKPIEDMTVEDYTNVLDVHLVGAFALTKAIVPHMRSNKKGNIIFIASMTSYIGQPYVMGYSTAKAGYLGMIHTLASEVGADGIRVNGIAPGWIDTPMFRKATDGDDARKNKILGRTPMNKFGEPKDIGWACVYLCSDAAKFVTGAVIPVDGGALTGF